MNRTIVISDEQLEIIRKGLVKLKPDELTAEQNYQLGIMVALVDEVMEYDNPKTVHGWVL